MEEGDNNTTDLFGEGGNDGFERELVLDRSIAQEDAVVALREASDETTFVDNCLTLISCLTCHTMTEVMKESDRFIGAANSFPEVMKNWPSKDDATRVLKGILGATVLSAPQRKFPGSVETAYQTKIALDKNGLPRTLKEQGKAIWKRFDDSKKTIVNSINKHWRTLKSGENETQLLHEILAVLWKEDCAARAKSRLSSKVSSLKKKVENNKEVTEEVVNFLSKHDVIYSSAICTRISASLRSYAVDIVNMFL